MTDAPRWAVYIENPPETTEIVGFDTELQAQSFVDQHAGDGRKMWIEFNPMTRDEAQAFLSRQPSG
jgi:hypothetical protein